jgi:hypothetical protein
MANRRASEPKAPRKRQPATKRAKAKTAGETALSAASTPFTIPGDAESATPATTSPAEERNRLIAETAYFIAQQRGFAEGREIEDWLEAEAIVNARLEGKAV